MVQLECVTANLNKAHDPRTLEWLHRLLNDRRPALMFGQELRVVQAEAVAAEAGYHLIRPPVVKPRWWMGSWIMARSELEVVPDPHLSWARFECYLAAGFIELPRIGQVRIVSVHASPRQVTRQALAEWGVDAPAGRLGPTGQVNRPWYSDLVLHTLGSVSADGQSLLAAGDYNESREYQPPFGSQFFARVERSGLVDVTYSHWQSERQTHFDGRHPKIQVDHVLASPDVAQLVVHEPFVDPDWIDETSRADRSDHAPVWWTLSLPE